MCLKEYSYEEVRQLWVAFVSEHKEHIEVPFGAAREIEFSMEDYGFPQKYKGRLHFSNEDAHFVFTKNERKGELWVPVIWTGTDEGFLLFKKEFSEKWLELASPLSPFCFLTKNGSGRMKSEGWGSDPENDYLSFLALYIDN